MSRAILCDQCETTLPLNAKGEHEGGEDAGWLRIVLANGTYDLCTRSCAHAFLDREDVVGVHEEWLATITGIARAVRGDDDGDQP